MCGRTPLEDGVKLVVDHKVPREWGGTDEIENLQPLCEEDNSGKKAHFATYSAETEAIRQALAYPDPQQRVGELLKAFAGRDVPSDLLEIVASAQHYQADWQRRLRELRDLGWDYTFAKRSEGGRVRTYYQLTRWQPWPDGGPAAAIRRLGREKRGGVAD